MKASLSAHRRNHRREAVEAESVASRISVAKYEIPWRNPAAAYNGEERKEAYQWRISY
jgi:hypothetical protein